LRNMNAIVVICLLFSAAVAQDATSLKSYNVDIKETSVSGISSGANFAVQMQVAFSSFIKGAGIVAGGPFHCGAEHLMLYCMTLPSILGTSGVSSTKSWSGNKIDDVANMKHQKVYIISGTLDIVVTQPVVNQLYDYYVSTGHFVDEANVHYNKKLASGHTFPTDFDSSGNNVCSSSSSPYISNCGFDGAGAILQHIYPDISNRSKSVTTGEFIKFKQTEFGEASRIGLDDYGYLYVPKSCANGTKCRLHIAFHGCQQSFENLGTKFIHNTGYDKWAENNNLIVLFPQTKIDLTLHFTFDGFMNNMNACWDWIGMYDTDFANKEGLQMSAIRKMIQRITGH